MFITLEGGEGAGKSTQAKNLAAVFEAAGREVILTREPGGTPGAEAIRGLLLNPDTKLSPLADTFLHFGARADHVEKIIAPAVARGAVVICDRFYDSTLAYQGFGLGVKIETIAAFIKILDFKPDVSIFLELPDILAKARLAGRGLTPDRYDLMGEVLREKVAAGFRGIAASDPKRCVVVDAVADPQTVTGNIVAALKARGFMA
jgi:dTMP kinase